MSGFLDLFAETGRRRVGGGGKTIGAEQIEWHGAIDGQAIALRSTVRVSDPRSYFLTSSSQRISYGKGRVLADAQFVDLEVRSPDVPDQVLDLIGRLAQAVDDRPVRVRRAGEPVRGGKVTP